ncbi:MAG: FimB/Mfa2 family fimbrial subunit [Bacteroidales bacterium]
MLKRVSILILLGVMALISGCVHEDTEDCIQGIQLRFTYTLNNQQTNLFGANVEIITVFVFDESGKYIKTYDSKGTTLTKDYIMTLPLKPGNYNFIALGGNLSSYQIVDMINSEANNFSPILKAGVTDIKGFSFLVDATPTLSEPIEINDQLVHLFHGKLEKFNAQAGKISEATIDLIKDTKDIHITVLGIDYLYKYANETGLDINNILKFALSSNNGRYRYDNSLDEHSKDINYNFHNTKISGDTLWTETRILRLFESEDKSELTVTIPGLGNIYQSNLVSAIMQNPVYSTQIDLDREDQFNFIIKFQPDYSVSISINDWNIINIAPSINVN